MKRVEHAGGCAGCLIASVSVVLVYNMFLDWFMAGFAAGAVR